jgi:hypothetical protein
MLLLLAPDDVYAGGFIKDRVAVNIVESLCFGVQDLEAAL